MRNLAYHFITFCFLTVGVLTANAVSLKVVSASDAMVALEGETTVDVTVINESDEPITDVDFVLIVNKVKSSEVHVDLPQPVDIYGTSFVLSLPISADEETGNVSKQVSVTKVNGAKNQSDDNKADFTLFTLTQLEPRKVVMEEYTGLWCGFCPRGEAALDRLQDEFGARFIGISVHSGDAIENRDYVNASLMPDALPKASLQRIYNGIDPYSGTSGSYNEVCPIRHDVETIMAMPAEAAVELAPAWADDSRSSINPNARVTFRFSTSKARYAIGYVLLEDSMTGTGRSWAQANYYYKDENARGRFHGDEYMDRFFDAEENVVYNGTNYIPDYVCRRVAISAQGIQRGIANSIPLEFTADETLTFDHSISTVNTLIQDKDHFSVVALLFNVNTGDIVNAAVAKLGDDSAMHIAAPQEAKATGETVWYSANGQRLNGRVKGLNIVRMADGSVKKVIVK